MGDARRHRIEADLLIPGRGQRVILDEGGIEWVEPREKAPPTADREVGGYGVYVARVIDEGTARWPSIYAAGDLISSARDSGLRLQEPPRDRRYPQGSHLACHPRGHHHCRRHRQNHHRSWHGTSLGTARSRAGALGGSGHGSTGRHRIGRGYRSRDSGTASVARRPAGGGV